MIVLEWLFLTIAPCDAAEPWQLGSQDAATPMMQGIIDLHHDIFFFLILILVFVSRILVRVLWHFQKEKNPIPQRIVHGTTIESLRPIFPSIIPMFIAIPAFALLFILCSKAGVLNFFYGILCTHGVFLGRQALSAFLIKKGLSGWIAFFIPLSFRLILNLLGGSLVMTMDSSGSEGWWAYFSSSEDASPNPSSSGAAPHNGNHASVSTEGAASPGHPGYEPDERIGGDSIRDIQRRLLASKPFPSAEEIYFAHVQAEDLLEVKARIIGLMQVLYPSGDWERRGARALDNPTSATGESSLERLYSLLGDLEQNGPTSRAFFSLTEKVALRRDNFDAESSA
ncbi:hypothetical protein Tco_0552909 [Tanacetum coccineum]|uniref:Cytochrome c oxidase subunit 2 n=1 Tax=Tanacetum coccineum TaxID=301880 RepID=A0ABQ5C7X5_9ASTR